MIQFDDHMFQNGLKSPTSESNMAHVEPQQIKHPKTSRTHEQQITYPPEV